MLIFIVLLEFHESQFNNMWMFVLFDKRINFIVAAAFIKKLNGNEHFCRCKHKLYWSSSDLLVLFMFTGYDERILPSYV